jgi:hypothetical protein
VFRAVLAGAIGVLAVAAWHVASAGLTLSHYDARAHLVVARRVFDSLTPGWRQLGAVWLPLPHLLNLIPVQWNWAYRTGAIAVAISIVALAWGLARLAEWMYRRTNSRALAVATPALVLLNPNLLYLGSTPMTEPLLIGLSLAAVAAFDAWIEVPTDSTRRRAAWLTAALVLTRYEGWLVASGLVSIAFIAGRRRPVRDLVGLVTPAAGAIACFLLLSVTSTGRWLPSTDFFVPNGEALHQPLTAASLIWNGMLKLGNTPLAIAGLIGAAVCVARSRRRVARLLPLALTMAAALPLAAFTDGHPFRIRYMVPLVAASAVLAGVALSALPRRVQAWAAPALVAVSVWLSPPFSLTAPMPVEAQWETPFRVQRQTVSRALAARYDGTPILASMGSLAHYMHESAAIGLNIANFVHEGNGDLWMEALRSPRRSVHWILIEERAEGGDMLAARARSDPEFLNGFTRVAEGGGLALYQRTR